MGVRTISGHARLAGNTSGDEDNVGTSETLLDASRVGGVAFDLWKLLDGFNNC